MTKVQWHQIFLSLLGVGGIMEFFGTYQLSKVWSKSKRVFLGSFAGLIYVSQAVVALPALMGASSLEIFGFVGCILGSFGAARMWGSIFMAVQVDSK